MTDRNDIQREVTLLAPTCPSFADKYVCDLDEGHDGFHFDCLENMQWMDHQDQPVGNGSVALVLLGAAASLIIGVVLLAVAL